MFDQPLMLEPLLRLMPLPPSLARHAPLSSERKLRSVRLQDTPLAEGTGATFDETCVVSFGDDMSVEELPLKLNVHGGKKLFKGVHLTMLSKQGQVTVLLGDDNVKVFIGTQASVRAGIHLFRRSTAFIGDRVVTGPARMLVQHSDLVIGEDCHLVEDVLVQCNEPHAFIDLARGELLNGERTRVYLGRHVLVQRRAIVMPGVRVGDGAIIQPGSVVSSDVAPNTMVGGSPAVVLREQVAWERDLTKVAKMARAGSDE